MNWLRGAQEKKKKEQQSALKVFNNKGLKG